MPKILPHKKTVAQLRKLARRRHFFLSQSPGLGLSLAIILGLINYKILPVLTFSETSIMAMGLKVILFYLLNLLLFPIIAVFSDSAFETLNKVILKRKGLNSFCLSLFATILFFPVGLAVLIFCSLKKTRWGSLCLFALSFALFIFAIATETTILPLMALLHKLSVAVQAPMLIAGLMWLLPGRRTSKKSLCLVLALAICLGGFYLSLGGQTLRQQLIENKSQIQQILQENDIMAFDRMHYQYDASNEQLASLNSIIQANHELNSWKYELASCPQERLIAAHRQIVRTSPGIREQLLDFVAHCSPPTLCTDSETLYYPEPNSLLPELSSTRTATRFLLIEMIAHSDNPTIVEEDNAALEQLRDWLLLGKDFEHILSAYIAELSRLRALTRTLPSNNYTEEKWQDLLGNEPDWRQLASSAEASDYCRNSFLYLVASSYPNMLKAIKIANFCGKFFDNGIFLCDWHWHIVILPFGYFLASDIWRTKTYSRIIQATLDHNTDYKVMRKLELEIKQANDKCPFFNATVVPYHIILVIENMRRLANIARKITNRMQMSGGKLPDNLRALGEMPKDAINEQPFGYKYGNLDFPGTKAGESISLPGFVLFSHYWDESLPEWNHAPAMIFIPLAEEHSADPN